MKVTFLPDVCYHFSSQWSVNVDPLLPLPNYLLYVLLICSLPLLSSTAFFPLLPSRSAGVDSHYYAGISLRQILGRRLLLAQCPEWHYLGLCWACHLHHYGQKIKS